MPRCALRRVLKRLSDSRGTSMVEAAVMTPLLLLLTFGIVEFAGLFYAYLALENGVSQATRFAVTGNAADDPANPGTPLSREGSIIAITRQATPTLTLEDGAFSFSHMSPGSTSWVSGTGGPNDIEKVTVTYTWKFFTPLFRPFFPDGEFVVTVASAMKNEGRFE